MSENTKRLGDISDVVTMSNDDKFLIIVSGQEWLISKSNLQKVFTGLSSDDYAKINKIVIDGNGVKFLNDKGEYADITTLFNQDQFVKNASGLIELSGYHTHSNQENILDKFTVDESGALLFNGEAISSYTLPIASKDTLGGIKVDETTITIDENGVIHGANTYELPTASDTVLGGVKVDGDTIKINDGIISAADFIKLVQHILNPEMQINSKTSDLNGDGKIDSADADEFKKLFLRYSKRNK